MPELISVGYHPIDPFKQFVMDFGGLVQIHTVPIPIDSVDGFTEAYYARLESFLKPNVRMAQSAWEFVDKQVQKRFTRTLAEDLQLGAWNAIR